MKQHILLFIFISGYIVCHAQTPVIRSTPPVRQVSVINNGSITNRAKPDTVPRLAKFGETIQSPAVMDALANAFSLLHFSVLIPAAKEFNDYPYWEFSKNYSKEISDNPLSKNWEKNLTWRKIPAGAVYGRWEISLLPFPPGNDPGFSGIIRTGIVETKGADSVYFAINYTDDANMRSRGLTQNKISTEPANQLKLRKKTPVTADPTAPEQRANIYINQTGSNVLTAMKLLNADTRKFYIRIVPLNMAKQPMGKISNDLTVQEVKFKAWKEAAPQNYLSSDYTITAVKYVPIHYPEAAFANCTIITSYNKKPDASKPKLPSGFGLSDNEVFGMSAEKFEANFQASFPPGTVLCPQPPKEKAWYEKAFDGIAGFVTKSIDGAAGFYNETKSYLKDKFREINCNANLVTTVVNPVTKLQEAAGPEVCGLISEAAFDYGMAAVGIPPSLPTTDDLTQLAEGQIVELACDKMESETGVPVPDEARKIIQKEFHDKVVTQSNKGIVNCGSFNVKPHPRGQFQTAYLVIEVTRTGIASKDRGIAGFWVEDKTTRTFNAWNPAEKKSQPVDLSINLFEHTSTQVPFLENMGDKTTVYVVLKPQESYTWNDKNSGVLKQVSKSPPTGDYYTPPTPTYEGYAHTPGFQLLSNGGSITNFSFGLKLMPGIQLSFVNK